MDKNLELLKEMCRVVSEYERMVKKMTKLSKDAIGYLEELISNSEYLVEQCNTSYESYYR